MWDVRCEMSFQELKRKQTPTQILILSSLSESFVVYYNASKMGLGGVFMSNGQVVAYASRQVKVHERNYPTRDLELELWCLCLKFRGIICMALDLKCSAIIRV